MSDPLVAIHFRLVSCLNQAERECGQVSQDLAHTPNHKRMDHLKSTSVLTVGQKPGILERVNAAEVDARNRNRSYQTWRQPGIKLENIPSIDLLVFVG